MNVYVNTKFKGHYPVGVAAVVIANNEQEAAHLLEQELARIGLTQFVSGDDMKRINSGKPQVIVLNDGDY